MKVAIITDTHYGARKGSKYLHDYFELFYQNVFFPALKEHGVEAVIHMGDVFDNLKDYDVHMIIGNHDTYYKNTNEINSPELLLQTYSNIKTYSQPTEVNIGGLGILFLPWINQGNDELSFNCIKKTSCRCAMGHLELQGFRVNRQIVMEHGTQESLLLRKSL